MGTGDDVRRCGVSMSLARGGLFTEITFNTRTADPRTTHPLSQQPVAPWAYPEPYAAAAPLGPAARSRVRGADSLAQALDLLANPHRIVDDRRLGDQTRVVQVEEARAVARATVCGAVARARGLTGCPRRETPWSVCMFLIGCTGPSGPRPVSRLRPFAALSYL